MKIYLAHPITGLSFDEVWGYFEKQINTLNGFGYDVIHPMIGKHYLKNDNDLKACGYAMPISSDHAIIERDSWMVSQADIVLVDFSGTTKVSIGCVMEMAWAYWLRKHTLVILDPNNPHKHAFILESADIIFENMEAALDYLARLAKRSL